LAVSYLARSDLAHVEPSESGFDALGKGVEEGRPSETRYVSKGLTRSRNDRLKVMQGGGAEAPSAEARGASEVGRGGLGSNVTALTTSGPRAEISGTTALKSEPEQKLSPTQELEHRTEARAHARAIAAERRAEAKAKGYEGDPCGECGHWKLLRNGTCLKCEIAEQRRGVRDEQGQQARRLRLRPLER
jgi:ribonucleoside-diphosphate reductase alpha chain